MSVVHLRDFASRSKDDMPSIADAAKAYRASVLKVKIPIWVLLDRAHMMRRGDGYKNRHFNVAEAAYHRGLSVPKPGEMYATWTARMICNSTKYSNRTVLRELKALIDMGWVVVVPEADAGKVVRYRTDYTRMFSDLNAMVQKGYRP